ncbi:hypothetical protein NW752_006892 [Fusarium irregulare]|uniref:Uncharacterized protein n=1 Tax=Fusarium irregulare TaxID=2494466 RepID=A0A9W8PTS3_9HYPO|nr:hypothetical protein NW766_005771 [Fusarium irregulare]KAJ4015959.1 hypothetical protein NW752_006892 [Fusarium irregulare]
MSERETDEPPSHEPATRQTSKEQLAAASSPALLYFGHILFQKEVSAEKEKLAALEKRVKCLQEAVASTGAEIAAWGNETTSLMEDLEYWNSKIAFLTEGQENVKHESVTIDLLEGLIASTKDKLARQWELNASLTEKNESFSKTEEELTRETSQVKANLSELLLLLEQVYRLEEKLTKDLKSEPGDAQEPTTNGLD